MMERIVAINNHQRPHVAIITTHKGMGTYGAVDVGAYVANFVLAAEEPELHLHPSLHQRLVHRIRATSTQSIVTTQSPHVAAGYQPNEVVFIQNTDGQMQATRLRTEPIKSITTNSVRRLYLAHRSAYFEALMGGIILIPEGAYDFEWLNLWQRIAQSSPDTVATYHLRPITFVPTSDAAIVETLQDK